MAQWTLNDMNGRPTYLSDDERKTVFAAAGGWAKPLGKPGTSEVLVAFRSKDLRTNQDPPDVIGASFDQSVNKVGQTGRLFVYMNEKISVNISGGTPILNGMYGIQVSDGATANITATLNASASGTGTAAEFTNVLIYEFTNPGSGNTIFLNSITNSTLVGGVLAAEDGGTTPTITMDAAQTANIGSDAAGSVLIVV